MPLIVEGYYCADSCVVTDRYTATVTVTPSAVTSMIHATTLYSPNSGNFGAVTFNFWPINEGVEKGRAETGQVNTPGGTWYLSSAEALNSTYLTVAVSMSVYSYPDGDNIVDGAKTADALCQPVGDNSCFY